MPDFLAASDVLGTGWFGAVAAEAGPGRTVAVVGDGAVGLLAVLAAQQLGAERIIAMSRHRSRQQLAREFGATDIVEERGDEGVAKIKELTGGLGAHSVVEAVGTQQAMMQAIRATRSGGHVGFVGVLHDVALPGDELFYSHVHIHGGPAPVRRFLPDLMDRIWNRQINPGKVFDLALPLDQAGEGYQAMDQRRAIKGPASSMTEPKAGAVPHLGYAPDCEHLGDWPDPVPEGDRTRARLTSALVARTAWHRYPLGQSLFVIEGIGLCQRRGGPVEIIRPGDRIYIEPRRGALARRQPGPADGPHRHQRSRPGARRRTLGRARQRRGVQRHRLAASGARDR